MKKDSNKNNYLSKSIIKKEIGKFENFFDKIILKRERNKLAFFVLSLYFDNIKNASFKLMGLFKTMIISIANIDRMKTCVFMSWL